MTLRQAKRLFIDAFYGSDKEYRKARKDDYCKAQLAWSCFIDGLCKDGYITDKQYDLATF